MALLMGLPCTASAQTAKEGPTCGNNSKTGTQRQIEAARKVLALDSTDEKGMYDLGMGYLSSCSCPTQSQRSIG